MRRRPARRRHLSRTRGSRSIRLQGRRRSTATSRLRRPRPGEGRRSSNERKIAGRTAHIRPAAAGRRLCRLPYDCRRRARHGLSGASASCCRSRRPDHRRIRGRSAVCPPANSVGGARRGRHDRQRYSRTQVDDAVAATMRRCASDRRVEGATTCRNTISLTMRDSRSSSPALLTTPITASLIRPAGSPPEHERC